MQYHALTSFPPVSRNAPDILRLFGPESRDIQAIAQRILGTKRPILGNDLEFIERVRYIEEPTILGVSDGALSVSVPFDEGLPYFQKLIARHPDVLYVGHAFTSADLFAFRNVGIDIDVTAIEDTIIWYYLTNAHLCKSGQKVEDGDGEKRGKGYMNLWTFISLYTSLPNWKECKGKDECDGTFCPEHDPQGYNGEDSIGPVLALPHVVTQARLRGVDKLYPLHRQVAYVLAEMSRYGVQVDVPYVSQLEADFVRSKNEIEAKLPFNPKSPKAVADYFKSKDITLLDTQEATIRETLEECYDEELALLLDYKEMGNGTARWFAPISKKKNGDWQGYMDANGKVHPRLGMFTSTGRFQCTSPNLQNVAKRRRDRHMCECGEHKDVHPTPTCEKFNGISLGKKVRRAIIATPGWYLLKADYSNAENRVFLYLSGHTIPDGQDLHTWVAETMGLTPEMEFCKLNDGSPREAAKTAQHGSMYLEGIQLKYERELRTGVPKKEIELGVRDVWWDWKFNNKIVSFTGSNLAQRAFGDKSYENRKKAQAILKALFGAFPGARKLQRKIGEQVEKQKAVITPHGYYLSSFGPDEERMKTAAAMWGSNPIAHMTKLALCKLWDEFVGGRPMRPVLQVHDEILCEVREDVVPDVAAKWLKSAMEVETPEIPGLVVPTDAAYGSNWRDTHKIKLT